MSNPSKRQCRRIDKTLLELSSILDTKTSYDRNYLKMCSLLQFILKEYCQSTSGLKLLSDVDFKDYFLIMISDEKVPSNVVNTLLSILFNSSKVPELFDDLVTSPIVDTVMKIYLKNYKNYYRSLRFLTICMNHRKNDIIFPLSYFLEILICCSKNISNSEKKNEAIQIFHELTGFFVVYITHHLSRNWALFVEENDISLVVATMEEFLLLDERCKLLEPLEVLEIAKISMCTVIHNDTPAFLDDKLKVLLSKTITWFTSEKSVRSLDLLLSLYHQRNICTICYLSESERNTLFYSMLFPPYNPSYRLKIATIYLNLCQEGSYRTHLVGKTFCSRFHSILSENTQFESDQLLLEHLKVCNVILSIFFTFNSGESLLKIAIESGIFSSLLSFIRLVSKNAEINRGKIFTECNNLLPKTYFLLQKTTDFKHLDHNLYITFIKILKRFRCLSCLNYFLFLSQTVPFSYLSFHSFISLVYDEFECSNLSYEEQYFDLKPTRSAPKSMKTLEDLPKCGSMILSNVLHNLEFSSFSTAWAISEGVLLLKKASLMKTVLQRNIPKRIEDCNGTVQQYVSILINTCNLINWLINVLKIDILSLDIELQDESNYLLCIDENSACINISNSNSDFTVGKHCLISSSPIFGCMFKHQFKEALENCLFLNYLSNESLACFQDYLLGNGELINFSVKPSSDHCYPWSAAFQLLSFSTMFEIRGLYEIVFNEFLKCEDNSIALTVFMFSFAHFCPKWTLAVSKNTNSKMFDEVTISLDKVKYFSIYLFKEFARPLLTRFCSKI